jgi:hypothetical protein
MARDISGIAERTDYHPRSATEIQRAAELIQFECRMQTKYKADFGRSYSDCRPTPARLSRSPPKCVKASASLGPPPLAIIC